MIEIWDNYVYLETATADTCTNVSDLYRIFRGLGIHPEAGQLMRLLPCSVSRGRVIEKFVPETQISIRVGIDMQR